MRLPDRLRRFREERGQILILTAFLLPVFIGLIALTVDAGFLFAQRRQAQNGADAAALAGAQRLWETNSTDTAGAITAAFSYAHDNGYAGSQTEVNLLPGASPTAVEVIVEEEPTTFFIHVLIPGASTVRARAVADTVDIPRKYGLIILDEGPCAPGGDEDGYSQGGSGSVIIEGAGAMINTNCDPALVQGGAGDLLADGDIDVAGSVNAVGPGVIDPPPRDYVPWQLEDPLAALTPPYPDCLGWAPQCVTRNGTDAAEDLLQITGSTDTILQPGIYWGGVKVNCSCTVTLLPGIFVMAGGGFTKTGSTDIVGADVMIFVTKHPTESPASAGDGFHFSGTGTTSLLGLQYCYDVGAPPCPPPYENARITFWQDESVTDDFEFAGDASGSSGIWYAPGSNLKVTGGANFGTGQIIVDTIEKSGNGDITITYDALVEINLPLVLLIE